MVRERAVTEIRRVAKMQPGGGTVKDRVMHVSSALEKYFCDNPEGDVYRASNGEYLPGPAESVSIALVDGISPTDFRNRCLLYTSPSPRDLSTSRMPSSA